MTSLEYFDKSEDWVMFSNCLHRCSPSNFLVRLSSGFLLLKSLTTVWSLVWVATSLTLTTVWALLLTLLLAQCLALLYEAAWLLIYRDRGLTGVLRQYSAFLAKVDVARGRSVPSPLAQERPEQVLPCLNPHSSSPDLQLLLDLLASRSGLGLALRCLAFLETDFSQSWAPSGLQADVGCEEVSVFWTDPVVLRYINSEAFNLHYGVELDIPGAARSSRIVSQQELRMLRQTWKKARADSVNLGDSEQFVYRETFRCQAVPSQAGCRLRVWTIVDGHLVSNSEQIFARFDQLRHTASQASCQSSQSTGGGDRDHLDKAGIQLENLGKFGH